MTIFEAFREYFGAWLGSDVAAELVFVVCVGMVMFCFSHLLMYPFLTLLRGKTYYKYFVIFLVAVLLLFAFAQIVLPYSEWSGGVEGALETMQIYRV